MGEVLVTGGTRVLGSALVPALQAAGHNVRVLSRRGDGARIAGDLATGTGRSPRAPTWLRRLRRAAR
jgi:nucleoside-diphosphate-sugar epimerase